jgi:PEP-CTERM motif
MALIHRNARSTSPSRTHFHVLACYQWTMTVRCPDRGRPLDELAHEGLVAPPRLERGGTDPVTRRDFLGWESNPRPDRTEAEYETTKCPHEFLKGRRYPLDWQSGERNTGPRKLYLDDAADSLVAGSTSRTTPMMNSSVSIVGLFPTEAMSILRIGPWIERYVVSPCNRTLSHSPPANWKLRIANLRALTVLLAVVASMSAFQQSAIAGTILVAKPQKLKEMDTFTITVVTGAKDDKRIVTVDDFQTIGNTAEAKAMELAKNINAVYGNPNLAMVDPNNHKQVIITNGSGDLTFNKSNEDATGSNFEGAPLDPSGIIRLAKIDNHVGVSGTDASGQASEFHASLGFDSTLVNASVSATQLPSLTINDLNTALYNQLLAGLPLSLRPNLTLDLPGETIFFVFPVGSSDLSVSNSTTDTTTQITGGLTAIPEPSALILFSIGALGVVALSRKSK